MDNQEPQINIAPEADKSTNKSKARHIGVIIYFVAVVVVVIAIAVVHDRKTTPSTNSGISAVSTAQVSISPSGLIPQALTINVGQAVTWTNNDKSSHQIASDPYPNDNTLVGLNSKTPILPGHAYSYVFNKAGTYYYHDNLNPYTIKGTIIVK